MIEWAKGLVCGLLPIPIGVVLGFFLSFVWR